MTTTIDTATAKTKTTTEPQLDPNEAYRLTQSRILSLQETILDSSKDIKLKEQKIDNKQTTKSIDVDSSNILSYTRNKYKTVPKIINWISYNPYGSTQIDPFIDPIQLQWDKKFQLILNDYPPFLPILKPNMINKIISVYIPFEIILQFLNNDKSNKRWLNNEIWGTDIYTDDSDIILVLKHIGIFDGEYNVLLKKDEGVIGEWDPKQNNNDIIVKLLILDTLQKYQGSKRYGIRTRDWVGPQLHDGLSYGVYSIEFKSRDSQSINTSSWV